MFLIGLNFNQIFFLIYYYFFKYKQTFSFFEVFDLQQVLFVVFILSCSFVFLGYTQSLFHIYNCLTSCFPYLIMELFSKPITKIIKKLFTCIFGEVSEFFEFFDIFFSY